MLTRQNKQSTSPVEIPSLNRIDGSSTLGFQFDTLSLAPIATGLDAPPPLPTKKKRSHGKAKPPGHIPRPPNAFIIFRTEYIRSMAKQDSTPEVSKDLGLMWRNMPPSEKQHWINQADAAKIMHKIIHPEYKFKPVHRRDEFGNYIRKPRRPNRPRVKKDPRHDDTVEHLSETSHSLEGKPDVDFPNAVLPSDASSASSPPPSPSPVPSLPIPSSSSSRLFQRRSSSVPLTGPDDSFFGTASNSVPYYPSGLPTSQLSRRYSKRPSTSMDFMCAGVAHSQPYIFSNNTEPQHALDNNSLWRTGHRRSISAPDFSGDIPSNLIYSTQNGLQEANPLTPINPVFGSMFERFSWDTAQTSHDSTNAEDAQNGFSAMQPFAPPGDKRQEYITVQIPETITSPTSDLLSATTSHLSTPSSQLSSTPAILQPAPVATFDFAMFQAQMNTFEFEAAGAQGGFDNALGLVPQADKVDMGMYNASEHFFAHVQDGPTDYTAAAAMQGTGIMPPQSQSSSDATFPPPAVDHTADLQAYQDGVRYTRLCPEITPPSVLNLNDLIVDGY